MNGTEKKVHTNKIGTSQKKLRSIENNLRYRHEQTIE